MSKLIESSIDWDGHSSIEDPKEGEIIVFYEENSPTIIDFLCPCGCKSRCPIPIQYPGRLEGPFIGHCWNFARNENGITITPSIRFTSGCKAHFNITDSEFVIHSDSGE